MSEQSWWNPPDQYVSFSNHLMYISYYMNRLRQSLVDAGYNLTTNTPAAAFFFERHYHYSMGFELQNFKGITLHINVVFFIWNFWWLKIENTPRFFCDLGPLIDNVLLPTHVGNVKKCKIFFGFHTFSFLYSHFDMYIKCMDNLKKYSNSQTFLTMPSGSEEENIKCSWARLTKWKTIVCFLSLATTNVQCLGVKRFHLQWLWPQKDFVSEI